MQGPCSDALEQRTGLMNRWMQLFTKYLLLLIGALGIVWGYFLFQECPLRVDEGIHYQQITRFVNGDWTLEPKLTTIPGFHLAVGVILHLFGDYSIQAARQAQLLMSCILLLCLWRSLPRSLSRDDKQLLFLHIIFCPIVFPFLFLLYTDFLSLGLVLISLLLFRDGKFVRAGILGGLAILVRQNNVVWLFYGACLGFWENWKGMAPRRLIWANIPAAFGLLGFVVFLVWNGGVALGDRGMHPTGVISVRNIVFACCLVPALFPVYFIDAWRRLIVSRRLLLIGLIALVLLIFMIPHGLSPLHPYNVIAPEIFLRNRLLLFFHENLWTVSLLLIGAVLGSGVFVGSRLQSVLLYTLYPASVVFWMPSGLIEQRYYLIPFSLFLLFRTRLPYHWEAVQLLLMFILSLLSVLLMVSGSFFF